MLKQSFEKFALYKEAAKATAVLSAIFVGTAATLAGTLYTKFCLNLYEKETEAEPLTEGEQNLLSTFFNDRLDPQAARIHRNENLGLGRLGVVYLAHNRMDHIYMNATIAKSDYSVFDIDLTTNDPQSLWSFGTFMHESTHVAQNHQRTAIGIIIENITCSPDDPDNPYIFVLDDRKKFSEFCSEQQAEMVMHYALTFIHPAATTIRPENNHGTVDQLAKVIEDEFPGARTLRERQTPLP